MSENTFDVGDRLRLKAAFTDESDAGSDPSEVTIKHRDPSGNVAMESYNAGAGNVVKDSTGNYHFDLDLDEPGRWYWRTEGDDSPEAAGERSFTVRGTQF